MNLPPLNLYLFGPLHMELNGAPVVSRRRKAQALLAYLAVTEQPHSRDALATLLWPEFSQSQARTNLRRELAELRGILGEERLLDDRVTVTLNREPPFMLDLTTFQQHLAQAHQCLHPGHPAATAACPACLPHLNQAAARYSDDFLAGFALPDSPAFDDWQFFQADSLRQTLAQLLERLVQGHHAAHQFAEAIPHARRWVALDPLHEPAHCVLMVAYEMAGQRAAALRQYESCVRVLEEELGVPPSEETVALVEQIRGRVGEMGQTLQLPSQLAHQATEQQTESPTSAVPPPFQAPAPPPHFVGRDAEITQLCSVLLQPDTPVYALVGMGGAGKTTLAMQVAQLLRDDFGDGVLWANAVSSDPMDIAAAWASAYDYDFGGLSDLESRAAAIRGVLAEKAVLIVLDNVEQSSGIRPLLPSGNHCAILLTTRDLDAAHALNAQVLFLGDLSAENSRQLLMAILGAARVTGEEEAAAEIGALLHYLPLAVEIVAQRLKSRPRQRLSQLVARLQDEGQRLDLEISDRAVRTSFAVSWAALSEGLQRCFSLLGVFAGRPFAAEAIAYIANATLDTTEEWLFALEALSLVKAEGEYYYRQHPLLADFAREKLVDGDGVSARMADYYYEFAQGNHQSYATLEPEWGNMTTAIYHAYQQENWALLIGFTDVLTKSWLTRARYSDARQVYQWTQEAALKLEDEARQALNLLRWGKVCSEQNDYDEASQRLTESLALYYRLEEGAGIANAQFELASVAIECGRYNEATELLHSCRSIHQILGDIEGVAAVMNSQARINYAHNDLAATDELLQNARQIYEDTQNNRQLAPILRFLAQVAAKREEYALAHLYCERAHQLAQDLQDKGELVALYYTWTVVLRRQGKFNEAKRQAEQALPLLQRLGLRRFEGMVCYQLGAILTELQELTQARDYVLESIKIFETVQNKHGKLFSLISLGDLYQTLELREKSRNAWLDAYALAQQVGDKALLQELQEKLQALS